MEILVTIVIALLLTIILIGLFSAENDQALDSLEYNQKSYVSGKQKNPPSDDFNVNEIEQNLQNIDDGAVIWQDVPLINQKKLTENEEISETEILKTLQNLIGQKDLVSGEILKSGEKIYVCLNCQLGYHEDSWYYLNQRCEQCKANSNQIKSYVLPDILSDSLPEIKPENEILEVIEYSFRKRIE